MSIKKRKTSFQNQSAKNEDFTFLSLLKSCGAFLIVFAVISLLSVLVFSFICYRTKDPTSKISLCASCALYFSSFVSSFIMAKKNGQKILVGGLMLGLGIILLTFVASLFFYGEASYKNALMLRCFIVLSTVIGAVFGSIRKEKKRKKHKIRT